MKMSMEKVPNWALNASKSSFNVDLKLFAFFQQEL